MHIGGAADLQQLTGRDIGEATHFYFIAIEGARTKTFRANEKAACNLTLSLSCATELKQISY